VVEAQRRPPRVRPLIVSTATTHFLVFHHHPQRLLNSDCVEPANGLDENPS
jgi:hypothetical protein